MSRVHAISVPSWSSSLSLRLQALHILGVGSRPRQFLGVNRRTNSGTRCQCHVGTIQTWTPIRSRVARLSPTVLILYHAGKIRLLISVLSSIRRRTRRRSHSASMNCQMIPAEIKAMEINTRSEDGLHQPCLSSELVSREMTNPLKAVAIATMNRKSQRKPCSNSATHTKGSDQTNNRRELPNISAMTRLSTAASLFLGHGSVRSICSSSDVREYLRGTD